jgi:LysW-gamma-L-alpha-aminoadipyl-6-phosphate/LysW-L-glutamyl-5-phosphate reductase
VTDAVRTVAIVGGSGYAGGEFLRLALGHPRLEVVQVTSERHAGEPVSLVHPHLRGVTRLRFDPAGRTCGADVVVAALPHGELAGASTTCCRRPACSSTSRPTSGCATPRPTPLVREPHPRPELLGRLRLRQPRARPRGPRRSAAAGRDAPRRRRLHRDRHRAGAAAAGARRPAGAQRGHRRGQGRLLGGGPRPTAAGHHPARAGVVRTYQPVRHRHTAEVQQAFPGVEAHLTATAVERVRGVLVTAHAWLHDGSSERDVRAALDDAYGDERFVRIVAARRGIHRVPDPRVLDGSNWCDVGFALDPDSGTAGDDERDRQPGQGTAGHALQALNVALGWDEAEGLGFPGLFP